MTCDISTSSSSSFNHFFLSFLSYVYCSLPPPRKASSDHASQHTSLPFFHHFSFLSCLQQQKKTGEQNAGSCVVCIVPNPGLCNITVTFPKRYRWTKAFRRGSGNQTVARPQSQAFLGKHFKVSFSFHGGRASAVPVLALAYSHSSGAQKTLN